MPIKDNLSTIGIILGSLETNKPPVQLGEDKNTLEKDRENLLW